MTPASLRRAVPADAPAVARLVESAYARHVPAIGRRPAPMDADHAADIAGVGGAEAWVVDGAAGDLVGYLVLKPRGKHLLLEDVAVAPQQQGQGVGALLLDHAEHRARGRGLPEIRLYTNAAMTDNVGYYARRGYVETHRAVEDGYRRVYFSRRLDE